MYENERWETKPSKNKRYERIEDKEKYLQKFEKSNIGKDVDPSQGRRYKKIYGPDEFKNHSLV